jgi:nitrogen regulatory protein PII 2
MKLIIGVVRDDRVEETKRALDAVGLRGVTFLYVTGRGQQKGRINVREQGESMNRNMRMQITGILPGAGSADTGNGGNESVEVRDTEIAFGFLPKRMLMIVADDEEVSPVVQAIVNANQTGRLGDGRIFICPMIGAIRVRTGEQGDKALS